MRTEPLVAAAASRVAPRPVSCAGTALAPKYRKSKRPFPGGLGNIKPLFRLAPCAAPSMGWLVYVHLALAKLFLGEAELYRPRGNSCDLLKAKVLLEAWA